MKLLHLLEKELPDTDQHMHQFRIMQHYSDRAQKKLQNMVGKGLIRPITRHPDHKGYASDWYNIDHLGMGVPNTPDTQRDIEKVKMYEKKINAHHNFISDHPLPETLTYEELSEIEDSLWDGMQSIEQEVELIYKAHSSDYDRKGWPLLSYKSDLAEVAEEAYNDYVEIFSSHDTNLFTHKANLGIDPVVKRLVQLGKQYSKWRAQQELAAAKREWLEKKERPSENT